MSVALAYDDERGIGWLHPSAVATARTRGDSGVYLQLGAGPRFDLAAHEEAPSISIPVKAGIGTGGFYEPGTGTAAYGSVGLAYSQPIALGGVKAKVRAEALALIRDHDVAQLGGHDAEHGTVVPQATIALSFAY